jgi:hypothetical protein
MSNESRHFIILFFSILMFGKTYAQESKTIDFFDQIKTYDLSTVLTADSILTEDREDVNEKLKRAEILGFIGDDYQRFFIHFVSVIQNPTNPYEYLVFGKTKVKENIRSFQGTITIRQASIYKSADIPTYKQGFANCDVILFEDKKQSSTGFIKGRLKSEFLIDNKGQFRYDALMFVADGFSNNQFVGNWTSYKTNTSKKCNWGDYRIPDCGNLDIGAGEFSVNEKYIKNGWLSLMLENQIPNGAINKQKENKITKNLDWWK